eukprot:1477283-Rhodomonas_salina.3
MEAASYNGYIPPYKLRPISYARGPVVTLPAYANAGTHSTTAVPLFPYKIESIFTSFRCGTDLRLSHYYCHTP